MYPKNIDKWQLYPLKGNTNQAFMGVNGDEKVFIKRNASPFLAALSREGITPRLVWNRRMTNGDTLTAQEWLDGKTLTAAEVGVRLDVIRMLRQVHTSEYLKSMLYKVAGLEVYPQDMLLDYTENLPAGLKEHHYLTQVLSFLETQTPVCTKRQLSVCHGDLTHHNWLLSEKGQLFLVDWDSVRLSDAASDIGLLLGRYIVMNDWPTWLSAYGLVPTEELLSSVYWYALMHQMLTLKQAYLRQDVANFNEELFLLKELFES